MGELRILMTHSLKNKEDIDKRLGVEIEAGDTKIIWDSDNKDEVDAARATFERLVKKGFAAFTVKKNGDQGSKITEFDPDEEKMIMIMPMAGG